MARTIATIYAAIAADKDTQTSLQSLAPASDTSQALLAALNSSSKVAVWRLWAYITAVAIYTHEVLWDIFKEEVTAAANAAITGTVAWYHATVLKYQHGDALAYNDTTKKWEYSAVNAANQVVKLCTIAEQPDGILGIKVAKLGSSNLPEALSGSEQTGLISYLKKLRFAGTRFTLFSGAGDLLKVTATIYYDGTMTEAGIQSATEAAINGYIRALPFNGELLVSKLVDAIQSVAQVNDIVITKVETKAVTIGAYSTISRNHVAEYGYYRLSTVSGETLADTLTFVAQ